jgi:hypothetical protein
MMLMEYKSINSLINAQIHYIVHFLYISNENDFREEFLFYVVYLIDIYI